MGNTRSPDSHSEKKIDSHNQASFFSLSTDILNNILTPLLTMQDLVHLTSLNKNFNSLFRGKPFEKALSKLLTHAVRGQLTEVEALLKIHPILLLHKGTAIDYSNRIIQGTAYQMALGAGDDEMAAIIQAYLQTLPNGEDEIIHQEKEQFSSDEKPDYFAQHQAVDQIMDYIFHAPDNAIIIKKNSASLQLSEECQTALANFKKAFISKNKITRGNHFDIALLWKAYEKYETHYYQFGHWASPKNILLACQVIGYLHCFLPANFAQAFCEGLDSALGNKKNHRPQKRSLKFSSSEGDFFPLNSNGKTSLGRECLAGFCGGKLFVMVANVGVKTFKQLCQLKLMALQNLCKSSSITVKPKCFGQ